MNMIKGNDLRIYADGVAIAAAKSCELDVSSEIVEVSSPSSGEWRSFRSGRKSWSVSVSGLVLSVTDGIGRVGSVVTIRLVADGEELTGDAICTTWRVTGQRGALAQGSFMFQGTGRLSL